MNNEPTPKSFFPEEATPEAKRSIFDLMKKSFPRRDESQPLPELRPMTPEEYEAFKAP